LALLKIISLEFQVENGAGAVMTHLLYGGNKRTMKLLYAIAKRKLILTGYFSIILN